MPETVVIIGGGIAGLAAAYTLRKESDAQVILLESQRLGGKIASSRLDGFLIEHGPDAIFTAKPAAMELIQELGLQDEIIEPQQSEFAIYTGGKLHTVPRAMASLMSIGSSALEKVGFLTAGAKRRVLAEGSVAKGSGGDESIASFFRRRFGRRFSMTVAEPMLAGIHAGNPEQLSMAALYPGYLGLEQKNGSLSQPSAPQPTKYGGSRPGFISLRDGIQTLSDTLADALEDVDIREGVEAFTIQGNSGRVVIGTRDGDIEASALIIACPAFAASRLLQSLSAEVSEKLRSIRHVSTAIATFAYPLSAFPEGLRGNGFLVPYAEDCDITGCTWSSNKWEGRAPEGHLLMRAFMGKDGVLNVDAYDAPDLLEMAEKAIDTILKPKQAPELRHIHVWHNAMPQYEVGHLDLMQAVEDGLRDFPIWLAGSGYRGSGIPDCIRQGREAARASAQELQKVLT